MGRGEGLGTVTYRERPVTAVIERMEWCRFKPNDVKMC